MNSAYHLHKDHEFKAAGETSCDEQFEEWKAIWKMRIQNGVKVFIWRACKEAIPTLSNLKKRHVVEEDACKVCGLVAETTGHVLWGCPAARDVWSMCCKKIQKMTFQSDYFLDIWEQFSKCLKSDELEEAAVIARLIWYRRNETIHGKVFKHPVILYQAAKDEVLAYKNANSHVFVAQNRIVHRPIQRSWQKPREGVYKVNWDAATKFSDERIGIGVIARDFEGQVIDTLQAPRSINCDSLTAEAYGLLLAAIFTKEMGLSKFVFEGDAMQVVSMANMEVTDLSLAGLLIADAKGVLTGLSSWAVIHTSRQTNMAAHILAWVGLDFVEDKYTLEEIPLCIQTIVISDLM